MADLGVDDFATAELFRSFNPFSDDKYKKIESFEKTSDAIIVINIEN